MRQRSRARRKQRAAIALGVVASLVAVFAALQIFTGDGEDDTAGGTGSSSTTTNGSLLGDGPGASSEEDPAVAQKAADPDGSNPLAALPNPYAQSRGSNRLYRVTLQLTSDGAVYEGHDYRDGKRAGSSVINKTITINRTVRGPLPLARIGGQVLSNATYATCTITLDGVVVSTRTARKPGYVTVCVG